MTHVNKTYQVFSEVLITVNRQYQHCTNQELHLWVNKDFQNGGVCGQAFPPPPPSFLLFALVPTLSMNSHETLATQAITENGLENDTGTQCFSTCHGSQNGHSFGR